MHSIILRSNRICVLNLYLYAKLRAQYESEYSKYQRTLDTYNRILTRYERLNPELLEQVHALTADLRILVKGIPDVEGVSITYSSLNEGGTARDEAARYQAKRIFRVLAKVHHPDHGGDPDVFARLRTCMQNGDIVALRHQVELDSFHNDLYHQSDPQSQEIWRDCIEEVKVRTDHIAGTEAFKIIRAHVASNVEQARQLMELLLRKRIIVLNQEILYYSTRNV